MNEITLNNDAAGVDEALKAYSQHSAQVDAALSADPRQGLQTRVYAIGKARGGRDFPGVALNVVKAFGFLVAVFQPQGLEVPAQVAILDYAGFKLKVLMHGSASDWSRAPQPRRQASRNGLRHRADPGQCHDPPCACHRGAG